MKKLILFSLLLLFILPCYAINWIDVTSTNGQRLGFDKDSLKEYDGYYFYNVKMYTNSTDDPVVTMQCALTHPFCARIKQYKLSKYNELAGDYDNITSNQTQRLEPVTFESRAYAAYKKARELSKQTSKPRISF